MRILMLAAAAFALAACAPNNTPAPSGEDLAGLDAAACAAAGGEIRPEGRLQAERCVILYTDAGRPCTDGAQCQGECRFQGDAQAAQAAAGPAAGVCQADSSPFGCYTRVTDGRLEPTICVD